MCWSNLQPELVQQVSPLKGLMQCQNLWLRGQPLFLPPQSDKSGISFPRHSFLFSLLLNPSWREARDGRCEWNIFIRREENPRLETRPELIWANDIPTNPHRHHLLFHVLLSFASCHSRWCASHRLKSAPCQGRHISERHKTCRNINKQQAADSSQVTRGRLGLRGGGRRAVEVSSSGFAEPCRRQDKVYQVISQFKLLLGQRANWDAGCQMIRVRVGPGGALPQLCGIWGELWSQMMHLQPVAQ